MNKISVGSTYSNDQDYSKICKEDYADDEPTIPKDFSNTSKMAKQIDLSKHVKLDMKLKRKMLTTSSFIDQTFPMVAQLQVENIKNFERTPVDLVCVIDNSGSMSGEKIKMLRESFDYLFEHLNQHDRLSLVIFDNEAQRLTPFVCMTDRNKKRMAAVLKTINGRGGTNIDLGIMHALQTLKCRKYTNPTSSIFILSDGLDDGAVVRIRKTIDRFKVGDTYTFHTFGYGKDHDPKLMADIADLKDGNFYFIDQLDTIDECFIDCFGGLVSSVAQSTEIRIKPNNHAIIKGMQISKAYGDGSMWTKINSDYITTISQLTIGKSRNYILEVKFPKTSQLLQDHEKNIVVAKAEVTMTGFDGMKHVVESELEVFVLNEGEEVKDNEDDKDVMKHFYRVKGAQTLEEAHKLAEKKQNTEADKILKALREELSHSDLKNDDFIKNLIKDVDQAIQDVKPQYYEVKGKHNLIGNARAQMQERGYIQSNNVYSNPVQQEMVFNHKAKKAARFSKFS